MVGKIHCFWRTCVALAMLALFACDSQQRSLPDQVMLDGTNISLPLPQRLRRIYDIDPAAVRAVVTVNGNQSNLQPDDSGRFSGQIVVPAQSEFMLRIEFVELYSGQRLTLARAEKPVVTNDGNDTLSLLSTDYDYDSFDFDGDSVSNIVERQYNTSPLDSEQLPELIQVEVFAAPPALALEAGYSNYAIEATVGSRSKIIPGTTGQYRSVFTVVRQQNMTVDLRVIETTSGQNLTVATQSRQVTNPPDYSLVVFSGVTYNIDFDQDNDGSNNLSELIAGTDLFAPPVVERNAFDLVFDVPSEILNPGQAYATLEIDGQNVGVIRQENTYTASASAGVGAEVSIDVQINYNYQGTPLVLASFGGAAQPIEGETLLLQGFSYQHDSDNDGDLNYVEINQGSDPFNAPVQCTPISETIFATLTDDAYLQNSNLFDNDRLLVDSNRRTTLIRYMYDENQGSVTSANLYLTVGSDEGDGQLLFYSANGFDWNDESNSLSTPPLGEAIATAEGDWDEGQQYLFSLPPASIAGDFTVIVQQGAGNDVEFGSSDTSTPPVLELNIERCE